MGKHENENHHWIHHCCDYHNHHHNYVWNMPISLSYSLGPIFPVLWFPHRLKPPPQPFKKHFMYVILLVHIFKLMNFSSVLNGGILVTKFLGTFFSFHSFWGIKNYFHQLSEHFWEVKNYVGFAQNKVAIFISFHQLWREAPSRPFWGDIVYGWLLGYIPPPCKKLYLIWNKWVMLSNSGGAPDISK